MKLVYSHCSRWNWKLAVLSIWTFKRCDIGFEKSNILILTFSKQINRVNWRKETCFFFTSESDSSALGGWNIGYEGVSVVALMDLIWFWASLAKEQLGPCDHPWWKFFNCFTNTITSEIYRQKRNKRKYLYLQEYIFWERIGTLGLEKKQRVGWWRGREEAIGERRESSVHGFCSVSLVICCEVQDKSPPG